MNKASEAQARYDRENTVQLSLKLNRKTDADIISFLEGKQKQTAIKEAIRKAINIK